MSDDLVKRLRDTPNWMREGFQDWKDNVRTYDRAPFEAADRIEELEEALRLLIDHAHNCEKELTEVLHRADFCGESLPLTKARTALKGNTP